MNKIMSYDLKTMRIELIKLLTKSLNKNSKFYSEDYENIIKSVNKKTRAELIESLDRWNAAGSVSKKEINLNCQFK